MSEKTLDFGNIRLNKKEFYKSKQSIDLTSVNIGQIVASDKNKHWYHGFKYSIGYKKGEMLNRYVLSYLKWVDTKNTLKTVAKTCLSWLKMTTCKDDDVLDKYNKIWDKIKNKLNIKFHSASVYDEKYIKIKVKEFVGVIKTNFLGNKIQKENKHYTCIACVTIDSIMRMKNKNYPQVFMEECKNKIKNQR